MTSSNITCRCRANGMKPGAASFHSSIMSSRISRSTWRCTTCLPCTCGTVPGPGCIWAAAHAHGVLIALTVLAVYTDSAVAIFQARPPAILKPLSLADDSLALRNLRQASREGRRRIPALRHSRDFRVVDVRH